MKKFHLILSIFLFISAAFAQEEINLSDEEYTTSEEYASGEENTAAEESITGEEYTAPEDFKSLIQTIDFVMEFQPALYLNTESTLVSAPSPVVYKLAVGFLWPNYTFLAIQPTLSFFMMNHLYYDDKALPAEIENRTTTTLSFMIDIPAAFSLYLSKSHFQFNAGAGILLRFGLLASGVKEDDSGWTGSAGEDVKKINEWFWNDMRWLYVTLGGSWLYHLAPQLKAGPVLNCYIPVGGLIKDHNPQAMIISAGIKICR